MAETKKISYSYKEIEEKANAFLEKINPDNEFPISDNMWKIAADKFNAKIIYSRLDNDTDLVGSIIYDTRKKDNIVQKYFNKDIAILINTVHTPSRQLFTLAHEFGHYLLLNEQFPNFGVEERNLKNQNIDEKSDEYLANVFAGCVLMPINEILKYVDKESLFLRKGDLSTKEIDLLKTKFGVSDNVVNARIKVVRKYYSLV